MESSPNIAPDQQSEAGAALRSAAEDARREGRHIAEAAKTSVLRAAEEQKSRAAGFVRDLSSALHRGCDELRERGRGQAAEYVDMAAEELDRFGGRMEGQDAGALLGEIEQFARRRPGLVFGAALLAGFGIIRLAMSARPGTQGTDAGTPDPATQTYPAAELGASPYQSSTER